ncbi:MAG: hypothetical protein JNM50_07820 [Chromatiales bacterium]|jgi:hypothetical protein|nr:hypothetical protein [Chromatiales bacterium]
MRPAIVLGALLAFRLLADAQADEAPPEESATVRLSLGGVEWAIPKTNLGEDIPWVLRLVPGLRDGSNQVRVTFASLALRKHLPGLGNGGSYGGVPTAFRSKDEVARALTGERQQAEDIWAGRGRFEGGAIEAVESLGLVRVYDRFAQNRTMWQLVARPPDRNKPPPNDLSDFWLGSCLVLGPSGNKVSSCLTRFYVDEASLDLHIPEADLRWHKEINAIVSESVRSWRRQGREVF